MVEGFLPHDGRNRSDDLLVGDGPMLGKARLGILVVLPPESHEQLRDCLTEHRVLFRAPLLDRRQLLDAFLLQLIRLCAEPVGLRVEERPHVGFRDRRDGLEDALLAAARACAVSRYERVVVAAHHQHVAQRRGFGILRPRVVVEAEILLRGVGQQVEERGARFVLGVDLFGFLHHLQRLVFAAGRHAGRAPFAQVRHEDGEDATRAGSLLLRRREDGVRLLIRQRHPVENIEELAFGFRREPVDDVGHFPNEVLERGLGVLGDRVAHELARPLLDFRQRPEHLLALACVRHVVGDGRPENRFEVLRAVWQRRIGADRDALHALRAVFRDVERRFAPGDVLRRRVAASRRHDAERGVRRRRLVVAEVGAELGVEGSNPRERRALGLALGDWMRPAAAALAIADILGWNQRQQRLAAHAGPVGGRDVADRNFLHALEALRHDLHVGDHDRVAQPAELLHVLLAHHVPELFLSDAKFGEQRRDGEKRPEERVPLHAELKVAAVSRFSGDLESGQRVDANLLLDDLLASPQGEPLPRLFAFLVRLPHERSAFLHPVERVGMRERFGVAAEDHVGVAQVAVDPDALWRGDHEVGGRSALLLGSILGVRADVNDLLRVAEFVDDFVAVVEQVV